MSFNSIINFNTTYLPNIDNFSMPSTTITPNFNFGGTIFNMPELTPNTSFNTPFSFNNFPAFNFCPWGQFNFNFPNIFEQMNNINFSNIFSNFTNNNFSANTTTNWFSNIMPQMTWTNTTYKSNKAKLLPELQSIGYDSKKGNKIAREVKANATGFKHECGAYVGDALNRAGVFNITSGRDGYRYPELLKNNANFKEISTTNLNLSKLPAGCVLSYGKGVAGYNKEHGHVEITLGDGRAASDGITHNIKDGARVFVPVNNTKLA